MSLTYLQVGSWNIKHLGQQPTDDERSQSVYALTDQVEMAGIDVLALQELYVSHWDDNERRNEHLDKTCGLLHEHTGQDWRYKILENRSPNDTSQLCGALWNNDIVELVTTKEIPVEFKIGNDWLWDRRPHGMKFRTTAPILGTHRGFVIVPLHMKANGSDPRVKIKRSLETKQLAEKIAWLSDSLEEESIVLIGDTNCLGAWEKAIEHLEDVGFSDLNTEDTPTYARSKAPFDRIFVKQDRPEFRYSRQYILRSADSDAHERYLSDHYLIKTSVKIYVDPS